jgi:hypothetical protein
LVAGLDSVIAIFSRDGQEVRFSSCLISGHCHLGLTQQMEHAVGGVEYSGGHKLRKFGPRGFDDAVIIPTLIQIYTAHAIFVAAIAAMTVSTEGLRDFIVVQHFLKSCIQSQVLNQNQVFSKP